MKNLFLGVDLHQNYSFSSSAIIKRREATSFFTKRKKKNIFSNMNILRKFLITVMASSVVSSHKVKPTSSEGQYLTLKGLAEG